MHPVGQVILNLIVMLIKDGSVLVVIDKTRDTHCHAMISYVLEFIDIELVSKQGVGAVKHRHV